MAVTVGFSQYHKSTNFPSLPSSGHPSGQETAALGVGPRGRPAVPFLANRAAPGLPFFSNLLSFRQLGAFLGAAVSPPSGQQLALMMNHRRTPDSLALGMPSRDFLPHQSKPAPSGLAQDSAFNLGPRFASFPSLLLLFLRARFRKPLAFLANSVLAKKKTSLIYFLREGASLEPSGPETVKCMAFASLGISS